MNDLQQPPEVSHLLSVHFTPEQRGYVYEILEKLIEEIPFVVKVPPNGEEYTVGHYIHDGIKQHLRAKWLGKE